MERFTLSLPQRSPLKQTLFHLSTKTKLQLPFFSFGFFQAYPKTLQHSQHNNLLSSNPRSPSVSGQTNRYPFWKIIGFMFSLTPNGPLSDDHNSIACLDSVDLIWKKKCFISETGFHFIPLCSLCILLINMFIFAELKFSSSFMELGWANIII